MKSARDRFLVDFDRQGAAATCCCVLPMEKQLLKSVSAHSLDGKIDTGLRLMSFESLL